jgi:hypothetical protein
VSDPAPITDAEIAELDELLGDMSELAAMLGDDEAGDEAGE